METIGYDKVVDALVYLGVLNADTDIEEQMGRLQSVEISSLGMKVTQTSEYHVEIAPEIRDDDEDQPEPAADFDYKAEAELRYPSNRI